MHYSFSRQQKAFGAVLLAAVLACVALSVFYGSQYVESWRAARSSARAASSLESVAPAADDDGIHAARMRSDGIDLLSRQLERIDDKLERKVLAQLGALSGIADRVESQHIKISEVSADVANLQHSQSAIKFTVDTVLLYTKPTDGESVASGIGRALPSTPRSEASARRFSFTNA